MKAIETKFMGCLFRSRLEARWAVFFETMKIKWEYEPEGFQKGGARYLPDFRIRLGDRTHYVEVKGDPDWLFNERYEIDSMHDMPPILPDFEGRGSDGGLILLGAVPEPAHGTLFVRVIGHHKGTALYWRPLFPTGRYGSFLRPVPDLFRAFYKEDDEEYGITMLPRSLMDFQPRILKTTLGIRSMPSAIANARSARFEYGQSPSTSLENYPFMDSIGWMK